jgi:hypothetical protein
MSNATTPVLYALIETLLFLKGELTLPGRSGSIPTLQCVSGSACGTFDEPTSVLCTNVGINPETDLPYWKCEAELLPSIKFGRVDVSCEGYAYQDDPYVLVGSCALEYTLESQTSNTMMFLFFLLGIAVVVILIIIGICIYRACQPPLAAEEVPPSAEPTAIADPAYAMPMPHKPSVPYVHVPPPRPFGFVPTHHHAPMYPMHPVHHAPAAPHTTASAFGNSHRRG